MPEIALCNAKTLMPV